MVYQDEIKLSTQGFCDVHEITDKVNQVIKESKIKEGIVVVSLIGSTGGLTTIEAEPNLIRDFKEFFEKLIPEDKNYYHNQTWGDNNGFSHLRSSLLGTSVCLPVSSGKLLLGTWQQIIFIDFDNRPRERRIVIKIVGD